MTTWKSSVLGLVIGLILGAGATLLALRFGPMLHHRKLPPWTAEARATRMVERFTRELGLSADQKARVTEVLESKRGEIRALDAEMHPRFQAIRKSIKDEIRLVLTPEQKAEFEEMEKRAERRRLERREMRDAESQSAPGR